MRVLVLSQYYRPEEAFVVSGVAEGLAERGHDVRVLTGFPNYPQGRLFPGYRQQWHHIETINGIEVRRVPLFIDHSERAARRMLNYVSFGFTSAAALKFAENADVIYVYATQMTPALGPWLWRMLGGRPYVLHIQDLWPDSITGSSIISHGITSKLIDRSLTPWIGSVYRGATRIITIAPTMEDTLIERGVEKSKITTIYNWSQNTNSSCEIQSRPPNNGRSILYAGNVGDMQDLETAIRAAHSIKDEHFRLRILGTGVALKRLRKLSEDLKTENVDFLGKVPSDQMGKIYAEADFSLVPLKDLPVFEGTIPSKFQASLANSLPVITTVKGDVRALTEEFGVGFVADPEDVDSLASAFRRALAKSEEERLAMAHRAFDLYKSKFSFSSAISKVEETLQMAAREEQKQTKFTKKRK